MESTARETILFLSAVNNMFTMHVKILIECSKLNVRSIKVFAAPNCSQNFAENNASQNSV